MLSRSCTPGKCYDGNIRKEQREMPWEGGLPVCLPDVNQAHLASAGHPRKRRDAAVLGPYGILHYQVGCALRGKTMPVPRGTQTLGNDWSGPLMSLRRSSQILSGISRKTFPIWGSNWRPDHGSISLRAAERFARGG